MSLFIIHLLKIKKLFMCHKDKFISLFKPNLIIQKYYLNTHAQLIGDLSLNVFGANPLQINRLNKYNFVYQLKYLMI